MNRNIFLLIFILATIIFGYIALYDIFTFKNLTFYYLDITEYIHNNYILCILGYIIIYFVVVVSCLPFAWFLTISGAILFGWILGSIMSVLAAGSGACVVFIISRSIMNGFYKNKIKSDKGMYNKFKNEMKKNAFFYLLFLRLMPVFPFVFLNIASALISIKFRVFAITTFVGIIPGSIVYSLLGQGARKIIINGEEVVSRSLYSIEAIIGLTGLSLMIIFPVIVKKFKYKKNKND